MQNYKNHIRYYFPHHLVFYPLITLAIGISIFYCFKEKELPMVWGGIAITLMFNVFLALMVRQHYALNNQNRIVRLEMRLRFFILSGKRLESLENELTFPRIAALRFASDEELLQLINESLQEKLSPDEIKKRIKIWLPDHMRV